MHNGRETSCPQSGTMAHPVRCLLCLQILEARDVPSHAGIWPVYHADGKLIAAEVEPCRAG